MNKLNGHTWECTISVNHLFFKFQQESDDSEEEDEMTMKKLAGEKTEGNKSNNN